MSINQKIGGFFPQDKEGNILNPTHAHLLPSSLLSLLDSIIELYKKHEDQNLHSLWLRGSTPRGFFTENYSDIDIFALVKTPDVRWQKADWYEEAEENLKEKFGDFPEIEWNVSSWYPDFYEKNQRLSFYLKTQSLLLFGKDLRQSLPYFKVSDNIKMNLTWLQEDVEIFLKIDEPSLTEIHTILKVVIRSAFESIMDKEGRYTPDLYWCAEAFGRHCEKGKEPIFELLEAFLNKNYSSFYLKENIGKVTEIIRNVTNN